MNAFTNGFMFAAGATAWVILLSLTVVGVVAAIITHKG